MLSPRNISIVDENEDLKTVLPNDSQTPTDTSDVLRETPEVYEQIDDKVIPGDEHIYHKIQNNDLTVDNLDSSSNHSDFFRQQ
jgi:hypothetical protein